MNTAAQHTPTHHSNNHLMGWNGKPNDIAVLHLLLQSTSRLWWGTSSGFATAPKLKELTGDLKSDEPCSSEHIPATLQHSRKQAVSHMSQSIPSNFFKS